MDMLIGAKLKELIWKAVLEKLPIPIRVVLEKYGELDTIITPPLLLGFKQERTNWAIALPPVEVLVIFKRPLFLRLITPKIEPLQQAFAEVFEWPCIVQVVGIEVPPKKCDTTRQ